MVGTTKLSCARITDGSALYKTTYGHARRSKSAADLVVIDSIRGHENISSLSDLYALRYREESRIPSTLGDLSLPGYNAWNTFAMLLRSAVSSLAMKQPSPTGIEGEVTQVATAVSGGFSETTDKAVRVTECGVGNYFHEDVRLEVTWINGSKIALRDICEAYGLSLVETFRAYRLGHPRETCSVTTSAVMSCSEESKGARKDTSRVARKLPPWF